MIIVSPMMDRYIVGLQLALSCMVTVSPALNTPFTLTPVWRREGVVLASNDQLTVGEFSMTGDRVYTSTLDILPLTTNLIGNNTVYECEATIQDNSFVTGTSIRNSTTISVDGRLCR